MQYLCLMHFFQHSHHHQEAHLQFENVQTDNSNYFASSILKTFRSDNIWLVPYLLCSLNAAQDFPQKPFTVCNKRMSLTAGVTFNLLRRLQVLHANRCFLLFKEYRQFERDTRSQMQIYASTKLSYARSVETHFWFHKRMRWLALQFFFPGCSSKYWCKSGHYKLQMWGVGESPGPFQITSQQEVGMSWWVGQWSTVLLECFLVKLFEQGILKCLWQEK